MTDNSVELQVYSMMDNGYYHGRIVDFLKVGYRSCRCTRRYCHESVIIIQRRISRIKNPFAAVCVCLRIP